MKTSAFHPLRLFLATGFLLAFAPAAHAANVTLSVSSFSGDLSNDENPFWVSNCTVRVEGVDRLDTYQNIGMQTNITVGSEDTVEISVPQMAYYDETDTCVADSSNFDAQQNTSAQQRFVAMGISVNDEPQTGDPTLYRFTMSADTEVAVKWQHDFALRIDSDFTLTESRIQDAAGNPWMPAQSSLATGNPDPAVKLHWISKGETVVPTIDGQVLDSMTHPGLDVRFVPIGYTAKDAADVKEQVDGYYTFTVGQSPASRQQVDEFTMDTWAKVEYEWQIQYGVNTFVMTEAGDLSLVEDLTHTNRYIGNGTYWFDPETKVRVMCRANAGDTYSSQALRGWMNGDAFYFKGTGSIYTPDGSLVEGVPDECDWLSNIEVGIEEGLATNYYRYHGMEIDLANGLRGIQRPIKVQWTYGIQEIETEVDIGEYVFQDPVVNDVGTFTGETFTEQQQRIELIRVSGENTMVAETDLAIWDDEAAKLYPLVPGDYRVVWSNENGQVDVLVKAEYPDNAHYPHLAGAPAVNIDPNDSDSFVFKEVKYTENEANVDGDDLFRAETPGWSVLLFGELQEQGRGLPREFVRVRTVRTRNWEDCQSNKTEVIIGQTITDEDLDEARLGTGYVCSENARFNPNIYDAEKLDGLAVPDLYDMDALQSTDREKIVVNQALLPGPVIPVNLHPGASASNRIVVAWYADPATHDHLLWPHAARTYLPRWPENADEGLGRIVIASQLGSDGLLTGTNAQIVATAVTNGTPVYTEATTYDPTRLQQVQIYSQSDPDQPGYNPNEEHALVAPSLKHAAVSPRPPAIYALRDGDLNRHANAPPFTEERQNPATYTSDPFVLVQFYDSADETYKMRVYEIRKDDPQREYEFADTDSNNLRGEPYVEMEAGEPVIPFYPLSEVWGAVVPPETYGGNLAGQRTYWEDHKGTSWSVSGGPNAWFYQAPFYPRLPDFWWPDDEPGTIGIEISGDTTNRFAAVPNVGDSLAFLPTDIGELMDMTEGVESPEWQELTHSVPTKILYKSEWPDTVPTLKAGETLTFSGGEYRADKPYTEEINEDGEIETIETPGLPGVLAFASAEVVYDDLNASTLR